MLVTATPQELQETLNDIFGCMAIVEMDGDGRCCLLAANAPFFEMLGCDRSAPAENDTLRNYLEPEAQAPFVAAIQACLQTLRPEDFRHAFVSQGQTRWWRVHVKPLVASSQGRPLVRVMISALDITDKIALAEKLHCERERYQGLVDTAYDGVLTVDRQRIIKLVNAATAQMFGYAAEALIGLPLEVLLPERFRHRHPEYVDQFAGSTLQSRHMFERGEVMCRRSDGSEFPAEVSISKIRIGGDVEFTAVIRDISERSRLLDELKQRANTDPLTSLRNRRSAMELGDTLFAGHQRRSRPLTVVMLDLDNFKQVNDQYGHPAGDAVLVEAAHRFADECRKGDVLARIGGEEFLLLLAETDLHQAAIFAERLRLALASRPIVIDVDDGIQIPMTCSIGMAVTCASDHGLEDVIERADRQLYHAKRRGKNRVCGEDE